MLKMTRMLALALIGLGMLLGPAAIAGSGAAGDKGQKDEDAEREAIAKATDSFVAAFEKGDAKAMAAHLTENGEYTAEDGTVIRGRAAIEKEYAGLFAKRKGAAKAEIEVDTIRFPSRDTAIGEGHFKVRIGTAAAVTSKYTVLHVRENGKWLMAVVREWRGGEASIRDLDWLIGTWTAKRDDTEIVTKYEWWGDKTFIRMEITIKDKTETREGFQMIGADASTGQLRSWTFDPDGSFGEATWTLDGKKWVVDSAGVLTSGEVLTATNIFVPLDDNTFTFQSVQRTMGDVAAPDIGPVRVTRVKAKE